MFPIRFPVPFDEIGWPRIVYEEVLKAINFLSEDIVWARITFHSLDSIRVSRGEYDPYPCDWERNAPVPWVYEVLPSPWLLERYEYEKKHYGDGAYEFSGDVDVMLRDFSHYVFTFKDFFIEALAAGICFETFGEEGFDSLEPSPGHPFMDLPRPTEPDSIKAHGIVCEIWPNTRPLPEILTDAELCAQKLLQFAPVLDGDAWPWYTLAVRVRHGKVKSSLTQSYGRVLATFDGVATLENAVPYIERRLKEISDRRKEMGKA